MRRESSRSTGPMSDDSETSPKLTGDASLFPTYSAAGFPAKTSATPANGRALQGAGADCGWSFGERLCHYDPATSSWRTWQHSISGGLTPYSGTWPRAGTMRNGIVSPQHPLVPRISENGCSLWPTPDTTDGAPNLGSNKVHGPKSLIQVAREMWPTPDCSDRRSAKSKQKGLSNVVKERMWPTPTRRMAEDCPSERNRHTPSLESAVKFATPQTRDFRTGQSSRWDDQARSRNLKDQIGGQLNPPWVEWLMGFPVGWTDLNASATPSSPRSPRKSAA